MPTQPRSVARTIVIDGREWLEVDLAKFRMPLDWTPESGMYLLIAPPAGGIGGFAALAEGPPGFSPSIVLTSFEELPYDHPTPGTASLTKAVEATDAAGPVYNLDLAIRRGAPGADGAALITPSDYGGSPEFGQMLLVGSGGTSFELTWPKVGGYHWPSAISSAPSGTTGSPFTVAQVNIPAGVYHNNYYLKPEAQCRIEATGNNILVNLVARLNAVDGPIIGICHGLGGVSKERLVITPGPAAGSTSSVGRVSADSGAVVFFNTERESGIASYQALDDYIHASVQVIPA